MMTDRPLALALLCVLALFSMHCAAQAQTDEESPEQRDARMRWWREARFGMFIHWGVYAVPAGTYQDKQIGGIGEWIMRSAEIPVAEYYQYARQYNPVKYDPEAWAALAEEAGMKYIVITSKHHDGFALFGSAVTNWDVVEATPYGKDLIAPLAEAARRHKLKFGLYYSQAQDWTHPGGAKAGYEDGDGWDEAHKGSFDEYLDLIAIPQVREILTRYEPDILWWDTPVLMNQERADRLRPLLELRPGIISNNRLGHYPGDFSTPEQEIPATGLDYDWETCMTMNDTWGYKSYDDNWKSTETLIRNLVDIASKGGNYLLNVGPTAEGEIPAPSIQRLREIGRWMKVNGEAIYATTASPCRRPGWGRITTEAGGRNTTLYLHVFDWPADGALPVPVSNQPRNCRLLADRDRRFEVEQGEQGLTVQLTGTAPDPICSVVVLEIEGEPEAIVYRIPQNADGTVALPAAEAQIHGGGLHVETIDGQSNLGYWVDAGDWAEWPLKLDRPGRYDVFAEIAAPSASRFRIEIGGQQLTADAPVTGSYRDFQTVPLGQIELAQAGELSLAIRPVEDAWSAINLRSIALKPAE